MLGADTKNYFHAHDYVESFINHDACAHMTNYLLLRDVERHGEAVRDQEPGHWSTALEARRPQAIAASDVHLQTWSPNRAALELAWQEVVAA